MTKARRVENLENLTGTLWEVYHNKVIRYIEEECGHAVPEDCIGLIERGFRYGAICMEKTIGRKVSA